MDYDIKITGGTIIDGTGAPGYPGDLGIARGRIVALGDAPGRAQSVIEADGKVVCPGFVDIHTHYDAQIMWDPMLSFSPWHGVTRASLCSGSPNSVPVAAPQRPSSVTARRNSSPAATGSCIGNAARPPSRSGY